MTPTAWLFSDAPYAGGAERYLSWHLQAAGPRALGLIAVEAPGLSGWIDQHAAAGFAVHRIAAGTRAARARALWAMLRALRPRVLHVNLPGPYEGMLGAVPLLARCAGVPRVVVTEHLPSVGRVGRRYWIKRAAVPAVHRVIAVCAAHVAVLRAVFGYRPGQIEAIVNGVPDPNPERAIGAERRAPLPADLAARERGEGCRIVQVGALDERKGGDLLLRAACLLRARGVAAQLWLVGEGPQRDALSAEIERLGLGGRVHLAGHRHDVAAILRAADLVVLASRREGMPLSLLEAMALGLPVVATRVDGVPEVVRHRETGLLVETEDAHGLAWALAEAAAAPALRARWGRAARRHYEQHHTLGRMTAATFATYGAEFAGGAAPQQP